MPAFRQHGARRRAAGDGVAEGMRLLWAHAGDFAAAISGFASRTALRAAAVEPSGRGVALCRFDAQSDLAMSAGTPFPLPQG